MEMTERIIQIGDRVTTKKIGRPVVCTLMGIIHAELLCNIYLPFTQDRDGIYQHWWRHYPEWIEGLVGVIKYDEPINPNTYEEFCYRIHDQEMPEVVRRYMYAHDALGLVYYSPMEDLEYVG